MLGPDGSVSDPDEWIAEAALALGEERLTPAESGALLKLARRVAHGVERKLAPLSTFLAGAYAGRAVAEGASRAETLEEAVRRISALIPDDAPAPGESVTPTEA